MFISKYTCVLKIKEKRYLINTYNSSLIELDEPAYCRINQVNKSKDDRLLSKEEKELLVSEGFLVDTDEELQREYLVRMKYHSSKYKTAQTLKIDIGITDKCNFSCLYCFENGNKNTGRFTVEKYTYAELLSEIRNYIICHINSNVKNVQIVWYGGEPSLEYEFICLANRKIIEDSYKHGFHYSNIIITNGYSIDTRYVNALENQNLEYVQITLDGLQKTHDSRRNTIPRSNSFETIIENIDILLQSNIEVVIRVNVDASNQNEIIDLLDYLSFRFNKAIGQLLFISFGRVFGSETSLTHMEFEIVFHDLYLKAVALGFIEPQFEDSEVGAFCGAESMNDDLVVDFKGNIYKCWNDIFDQTLSVGNFYVNNSVTDCERELATEMMYMEELSLDNINAGQCLECEFIKYCGGLCPYNRKLLQEGTEENIYENHVCKEIVRRRIETHVEAYLNKMSDLHSFNCNENM